MMTIVIVDTTDISLGELACLLGVEIASEAKETATDTLLTLVEQILQPRAEIDPKELRVFEGFAARIQAVFEQCLSSYPELNGEVDLSVEPAPQLAGAEGWLGGRRVVVLFVPLSLYAYPEALRPIIHHELSHILNRDAPDLVFQERADEESKRLWELLKKAGALECVVERSRPSRLAEQASNDRAEINSPG